MSVTPFLMFKDRAEEAVELYTTIFSDSKRIGPLEFELQGQRLLAFNGGPTFEFSDGISLLVTCDTQDEIDHYWTRLTEGGKEGRCGWLVDRFGVSWQIAPARLGELLGHPDPAAAGRAQQAMMGMNKLDISELEAAVAG